MASHRQCMNPSSLLDCFSSFCGIICSGLTAKEEMFLQLIYINDVTAPLGWLRPEADALTPRSYRSEGPRIWDPNSFPSPVTVLHVYQDWFQNQLSSVLLSLSMFITPDVAASIGHQCTSRSSSPMMSTVLLILDHFPSLFLVDNTWICVYSYNKQSFPTTFTPIFRSAISILL